MVFSLARITWNLARWGQKQNLDSFSEILDTNLPSSALPRPTSSDFEPLTKAKFEQIKEGVHTVGEWEQNRRFKQAPMLDQLSLPPVADRLPFNPLVIYPPDQNGPYGGRWQRYGTSAPDIGIFRARLAYDGLVRWGPMAQQILPNLAVKWKVSDQGKTYTFWLRRGVRWSDGRLFSVDDILFWYNHVIQNPQLTPTTPREFQRDGVSMIVEKVADHIVRFKFVSPYGLFLKALASGRSYPMVEYPAHYLKQFHPDFVAVEKLTDLAKKRSFDFWYQLFEDRADWQNPEIPRLWPWILKVAPPAQQIVFERNPYYWKVDGAGNQLPYIDQMLFQIYDAQIINLKAMNGEIGMQGRHLQFDNYPKFKANSQSRGFSLRLWIDSGGQALALNLNHKDPVLRSIFSDRRFRIALSHAIDRNTLNEIAFFGIGQPSQMSPPVMSNFYSNNYEKAYTHFDSPKANQLLDEMGLDEKNQKGVRMRSDGKPIELTIELASVFFSIPMFQLVAQQWTNVGIKTKVKVMARQLFSTRRNAMLYDVGVWGAADEIIPVMDPRWFFPYSNGSIQGIGYARWFESAGKRGIQPPEEILHCMNLYKQIERTPNPVEHVSLFHQILDINRQNLWVIGTVGRVPSIFVVRDTFRNVPKVAVSGWIFRTPGNTAPECYSIDESPNSDKMGGTGQ